MMKLKKETVIRTVVLLLSLLNQLLTLFGKNPLPFSDTAVYEAVSLLCTVGASLWAWWKNNSFTPAAIAADVYLQQLKGGDHR
ncbi:MAG: phage holin [Clostridia bacterium]|nr:phage holin [Clostridia bacterium]